MHKKKSYFRLLYINLTAMKNKFLLSALLLASSALYAQQPQYPKAPPALESMAEQDHIAQGIGPAAATPTGGSSVIWSEDFANGFPAGWTVDNPNGECPWVYSLDGSWGYFNGNNGASGDAAIASTTAANGFLICDPDSANNTNYGQPSGSTYIYHDSYFVTSSIDLQGFPSVNLQFQQSFRFNNGIDLEVMVSTDSTTWTTYTVQGDATNNQASPDPDLVSINISQVAGNQPEVWIKIGWSARVYFWMIDDMQIVEAPDNDLAIETVFHKGTGDSLYTTNYTQQPWRQAQEDSMLFGAEINNLGSVTQTNVVLTTDVQGPVNYNQSSPALDSLPVLMVDSLDIATAFYPAALGQYSIEFSVASDSTDAEPLNNTVTELFEVTDTVYARDDGNYQGNGIWYGPGTTYQVGCGFDIYTQDTATSISVLFQGSTQPSSIVSINLYEIGDLSSPVASSPFNSLGAGDIATWVTFDFPDVALQPGYYVAAFETFSDSVLMAVSATPDPTPPQAVFINVDNGGWFYTQQFTPFIRLNTKEFVNPCTALPAATESSVSCNGASDGSVNLNITGGFGPISYLWSNGATTQDISGLAGGDYTVTITDNIGCEYTYMATVPEPAVLAAATNAVDENCGANDGIASIGLSGGSPPYFYTWNTLQTGSSIGGLSAGEYYVTYTDASGCFGTDSVTIGGTGSLQATTSATDATCGNSDGDATAMPSTGTAPYAYAWSNGDTSATSTGLAAGTYTATITDADGCQSEFSVNVSNVGAPVVSNPIVANAPCNGVDSGSVDLAVFGGTMPYSFDWSNGDTTQLVEGLAAGTYFATVTDAANCLLVTSFTITEPDALTTLVTTTTPSCDGGSDGQATVNVFGGTSGYNYVWSSGATTALATGLASGTYVVTVTDANGCTAVDAGLISDPAPLNGVAAQTNPLCNGDATGSAGITLSGGDAPYMYVWNTAETTDQIFGLAGGTYTVTATDANGCTVTSDFTIVDPAPLSSSLVILDTQPDYLGVVDITVSGGTAPYDYTWSGPNGFTSLTQDLSGLDTKGMYYVTVRDDNNCVLQDTANVDGNVFVENIALLNTISVYPNPNNGTFTVDFGADASGSYGLSLRNLVGQQVYSENINANQQTRKELTLDALAKGVYFLTVTNSNAEITTKLVVQ